MSKSERNEAILIAWQNGFTVSTGFTYGIGEALGHGFSHLGSSRCSELFHEQSQRGTMELRLSGGVFGDNLDKKYFNSYSRIYKYTQGNTMKKPINIRLDESLLANLDEYAKELDRTRTYLIEKAISAYFDTLDEMISDKRIDEIKSGKTEVFSLEEVAQKLGLG